MIEYISYMLLAEQLYRERYGDQGPSLADTLLGKQKAAVVRKPDVDATEPKLHKKRTWTGRFRKAA